MLQIDPNSERNYINTYNISILLILIFQYIELDAKSLGLLFNKMRVQRKG